MIRVAEFRSSEYNSAWGRPGDQVMPNEPGNVFDGEVRVRYYAGDEFTSVWRPVEAAVAESIAYNMEAAARNPHVGYSQNNGSAPRTTFYEELLKAGGDASKISKNCNGDCSAGTAAVLKIAGVPVPADMWTGNAPEEMRKTRMLIEIETENFTVFEPYVLRGDILYRKGHMAIAVDNGSGAVPIPVEATGDVWQRLLPEAVPGTELRAIPRGSIDADAYLPGVEADDGRVWYITSYAGRRGWTSSRYLQALFHVTATAPVYVRTKPSLAGKIVNVLEQGDTIPATGAYYTDARGQDWYHVEVDCRTFGWVSGKYSIISYR